MIIVREDRSEDHSEVRQIHEAAYGKSDEAKLVDALWRNASPIASLVAVANDHLAGHIMFSPVSIDYGDGRFADDSAG